MKAKDSSTDKTAKRAAAATAFATQLAREESALDQAISTDRFATYLSGTSGDRALARALYIWDRDVSIAILADMDPMNHLFV